MIFISAPAFADIGATNGAANDATCDTNVLGSDSGSVELTPTWSANNIGLKWTVPQNEGISGGTGGATSCTYGQTINLPSNPTKRGYVFTGWRLRPKYDFSTLDTSINGEHYYGRDVSLNNNDVCNSDSGYNVTCNADFNDLSRHQWKVPFSYGTIYGDAMCSTISGSALVAGNPINDDGIYCWCKVTGYKNNDNIWYSPNTVLSWVYLSEYPENHCKVQCALACGYHVRLYPNIGRAMLTASGN